MSCWCERRRVMAHGCHFAPCCGPAWYWHGPVGPRALGHRAHFVHPFGWYARRAPETSAEAIARDLAHVKDEIEDLERRLRRLEKPDVEGDGCCHSSEGTSGEEESHSGGRAG